MRVEDIGNLKPGKLSASSGSPASAPAQAAPAQALDIDEVLPELLKMTDLERADLIDDLTRKAILLMEAGEVKEAKEQLERVARIGAAFQYLATEDDTAPTKQTDDEYLGVKSQAEVLTQLRRELHQDDFVHIFGGKARWARFIGAW